MMNADFQPDDQEDVLDLNEIMRAFGIGAWTNLEQITAPSSQDTLQWLVEVEDRRYTLRERSGGLIEDDSSHRYAFRRYLASAGIPIPPLWLMPDGKPTVAIGETVFELEREAEGERFSTKDARSLGWVSAAGGMLARIHQASRRYPGPQYRWPPEAHIGAVVQGYLNLAHDKAETIEIAAIAAALLHWCEQWEAALPSSMMSIGTVHNLPEFHIHGDYHALNLRFDSRGVPTVLNWDASRWEKRVIELAYALFSFSALAWQPDSATTRPLVKRGLDPERANRLLSAYGAIEPPVAGEAAILGAALALVAPIATINGPLEDLFFNPHGIDEALIDDIMERLAWAASFPAWLARVRQSIGEMWK
jgi:Ser/Thr protein kinase RdoA (MazF antagonist)